MNTLDHYLANVTIVGAAGKMGRGIALLLLQECAITALQQKVPFRLTLIDASDELLSTLPSYLRSNIRKYAERHIVLIRQLYTDNPLLVGNEEIIDTFINTAMDSIRIGKSLEEAQGSRLVFEAIVEDIPIKVDVLKKIRSLTNDDCLFLTNTSSIPIHLLNDNAELQHRLIGFHFYNPPPIQKLIEIIAPKDVDATLATLAKELAARLEKTIVPSADIAGFIGNGHFIPELHYACTIAADLAHKHPLNEALFIIDTITRDLLIRPMGIFELARYVGIDVCIRIAQIMNPTLIHPLMQQGLHYDEGPWMEQCLAYIGPFPEGHQSWKQLQKVQDLSPIFRKYFFHLMLSDTPGCLLAKDYLLHSKALAQALVDRGVANSLHDVGTVLRLGFYHLYGPDDPWIPERAPKKDIATHAQVKNESFRRSGI